MAKITLGGNYGQNVGKQMPQAVQLEEAVLGAIMINKDAIAVVVGIINPESFYLDAHVTIFESMIELFEKAEPIDLLTLTEALKKKQKLEDIGGAYYLVELTNKVASAANLEFHARIVAQKHIQRKLISVSTGIIKRAYEDTMDVFDMLDEAEQGLFDINQNNLSRGAKNMSSLSSSFLKNLEILREKEDGLTGLPTGFVNLDRLTSGLQPSDLFILAARPGMGKTAFVLALARNAALNAKKSIAFFSLEMSALQLYQRLVGLESEIEIRSLRNGKLEDYQWQQMHSAVERLSDAEILIEDVAGLNIFELRAKARRLKMQNDIDLIVIDYLQLMSGGASADSKSGNREQEVSAISRSLKSLAKELNIPVIALSQLSRAVETRGGSKRPLLSDLRESGSIEQDADMVGFIYRPEYYQILEDEEGNSLKGVAELIIAKNRHGAAETLKLKFTSQYAKFDNLEDPDFANLPLDTFIDPSNGGNIMTVQSKMNTSDFKAPSPDEDIPF